MGRFNCCWCLFILLVLVVIVTNTGNAKKNSEQKRQKEEQIKLSEGTENTAGNKQQKGKKKGETKPSEKKTEGRKKVKKNKSARKKSGDYSTSFDPNWACTRNQARNYCFGSGFAGHDVSNMSEADLAGGRNFSISCRFIFLVNRIVTSLLLWRILDQPLPWRGGGLSK